MLIITHAGLTKLQQVSILMFLIYVFHGLEDFVFINYILVNKSFWFTELLLCYCSVFNEIIQHNNPKNDWDRKCMWKNDPQFCTSELLVNYLIFEWKDNKVCT
jgi:hypothetical protein